MESSHILGDAEECHSSESGWTMYIGSPMHSDDDDDGDDGSDGGDDDGEDSESQSVKPEHDSDDSMASDASSGPNHREHSRGNGKGGSGISQVDENDGKHCSSKKAKHPVEKNGYERRKQEKEESGFTAKGANGGIQSSSDKVKRNGWFGKRK